MKPRSIASSLAWILAAAFLLSAESHASSCNWDNDDQESNPNTDATSIDGVIDAVYEAISGARGVPRDWDRLRSLFHEDARLVPVIRGDDDQSTNRVLTLEEFIEIARPAFENDGFYESEVSRRIDRFAHIAHVFSTYEARRAKDEEPFIRGINSIQLVHDGKRWWILSITWDTERKGNPIPEEYRSKP